MKVGNKYYNRAGFEVIIYGIDNKKFGSDDLKNLEHWDYFGENKKNDRRFRFNYKGKHWTYSSLYARPVYWNCKNLDIFCRKNLFTAIWAFFRRLYLRHTLLMENEELLSEENERFITKKWQFYE